MAIDPGDAKTCYQVLRQVTPSVARGLLLIESTWTDAAAHGLEEMADHLPAGFTIRRDEIEARVLHALQEKLLRRDLFEEFCHEFTREVNRLRIAASAAISAGDHEFRRVQAEIGKLIQRSRTACRPASSRTP